MSDNVKAEDFIGSDDEYHDASSKTNEAIIKEITGEGDEDPSRAVVEDEDDEHEAEAGSDNTEQFEEDQLMDEEALKEMEKAMTDDEKSEKKTKAAELKKEANQLFKEGDYQKSCELYTSALKIAPTCYPDERSILYANRAAAKVKLNITKSAIDDCSNSILLNPNYAKAYLRRAKLYEDTDKLDESLEDYKKLLELEPACQDALSATVRLPPLINERNEKLKTEMVSKLKDIGNMILKPFGLSTNNFQMQQDPGTGSYSINFNQGQNKPE